MRNLISPGLIETNQTREQLKDPEWARAMLGKTLLGRLGGPDEVANVAVSWPQKKVPTLQASMSLSMAA